MQLGSYTDLIDEVGLFADHGEVCSPLSGGVCFGAVPLVAAKLVALHYVAAHKQLYQGRKPGLAMPWHRLQPCARHTGVRISQAFAGVPGQHALQSVVSKFDLPFAVQLKCMRGSLCGLTPRLLVAQSVAVRKAEGAA